MSGTYAELHHAHQGKSSDKWESYLRTYERLFGPIRDARINIVEIGVQNGGSLEVLGKYFRDAASITGCDIDPLCGKLRYDDARISVIVGNANSQDTFDRIALRATPIDLMIDDGSHISSEVVAAFVNYFPLVRPGGLYVVEDSHALYWENWGGGVLRGSSAQQLFKLLTDVINYEHWSGDLSVNMLLSSFFRKDALPAFLAEGWVESLEFLNSMVVIRKARHATHAKLGARAVVGTEFSVYQASERLKADSDQQASALLAVRAHAEPLSARETFAGSVRGAQERPFVSIGMPIYNAEQHLALALESLLAQDHSNFELIISDNHSTDGTQDICRQFAARDSRIRYIRQAQNQGMPWNFACVVHEAKGEYFMWAAHDDLFQPSFIRRCLETLAAHPEAIFCCTEINFIDGGGLPHPDWSIKQYSNIETLGLTPPQRIHELIRRMGWFATYGLMRLEDAKKMSLGLGVYGFDVVLIAELLLLGDFVKVHEPLFSYRMAKSKNAEDYQLAFNAEGNPLPAPKTPYADLAAHLLRTIYQSRLPNEQKLEIFADFLVTLSRTNQWWREEITSELIGRGASLRDSEFAMLLAVLLSRSLPSDTIKDNVLIRAVYLPAADGKDLLQIAEDLCSRAGLPLPLDSICQRAVQSFSERKFEAASALFAAALQQRETSELWCDWATARLICDDTADAERGFRRALQLDAGNDLAALKLGVLFARLDRTAEAVEFLERCGDRRNEPERTEMLQLLETCRSRLAAVVSH